MKLVITILISAIIAVSVSGCVIEAHYPRRPRNREIIVTRRPSPPVVVTKPAPKPAPKPVPSPAPRPTPAPSPQRGPNPGGARGSGRR